MVTNMKDFYTKAAAIIEVQADLRKQFNDRKSEITRSTADGTRKAADTKAETKKYQDSTDANEGALLALVAEARTHVEQALSTWKNADNAALTNVLLSLNAASQSGKAFPALVLEKVVKDFKDDPISIDVIRQAAASAGLSETVLNGIKSDYGTAPLQTLMAFEVKAPIAFSQGNDLAFGELIRAAGQGINGEDVVLIPSNGFAF